MDELMKFISESITAFFILQLINVILSTIKTIVTVKGKIWLAALINGIYYGFYTFIIKGIGDANFKSFCGFEINISSVLIIALITVITNLIGVYVSLKILELIKKDELWLIKVTVRTEFYMNLIEDLHNEKLKFVRLNSDWEDMKAIEIYSYNKEQSRKAISLLKKYKGTRYCRLTARMIYE